MNAYEFTLDRLPDSFTSHDFLNQLRKTDLPKSIIDQARHIEFLTHRCVQINKKTWAKKDSPLAKGIIEKPIDLEAEIKKAIEFLKANGYRVLRPEFVEV